jgi:hypothetical protein
MTYYATMTPTEHEKAEWSRLAQAAYSAGYNSIGHYYSAYASMFRGQDMRIAQFDKLQCGYRQWLVDGFKCPGDIYSR